MLLSQLRTGDLDLVVGRLADPDLMTGLSFEHLYSERISFVVRPDHPLLQEKPFELGRIARYTVLMPANVIRLTTSPGATAFTRMFQGANSFAQLFVNPRIADLAPA